MNKKILTILFLLIIVSSIAIGYNVIKQNNVEETHYNNPDTAVPSSDVSSEVDNTFVDEGSEVEIGEMI